MTLSCKGFIANSKLVNNKPKEIARFGELSTMARTFTTNLQQLSKPEYPGIEVLIFSNFDDSNGVQQEVHANYKTVLLDFSNWLYDTSITFGPSTTQQDVVAAINNRFNGQLTQIVVDPLIYDGFRYLPTRVSFNMHIANMPEMGTVLWLADSEFRSGDGYDEFEIRIVPPLDNVDIFLGSYAVIQDALADVTSARDQGRIEAAAQGDPYTAVVPMEINWIDPTEPSRVIPTTWYAIVYGPRGTASDVTLDKTVDYILDHSASDIANWRLVFPDLFRITRFMMIPNWQKAAMEGRTGMPTIYSPIMSQANINSAKDRVDTIANGAYFLEGMESFNHPYRSLGLTSFPGNDNRNNALSLWQAYPDYIAAEPMHEDWNRQREKTKQFSNRMGELIRQSEAYLPGVVPRPGFRVVNITNTLFISTKFDNIEFLMLAKNQPR